MTTLVKYPRTRHIEGSRLQPGDEDLNAVPFTKLRGRHLVVEEKVDGANAAVSCNDTGDLLLQSRGHYLVGGRRERHFNLFKAWASSQADSFRSVLGPRFLMYGEWLYAKHTIYYDKLPHFFLEFDIFDRQTETFLSTERRRSLLESSQVRSVPVLYEGRLDRLEDLMQMVTTSLYKSVQWKDRLRSSAQERRLDVTRVVLETDMADEAEGLYIKVEEEGVVKARYKWIRASFLTTVIDSGTHWLDRKLLPNELADEVDIFQQET